MDSVPAMTACDIVTVEMLYFASLLSACLQIATQREAAWTDVMTTSEQKLPPGQGRAEGSGRWKGLPVAVSPCTAWSFTVSELLSPAPVPRVPPAGSCSDHSQH